MMRIAVPAWSRIDHAALAVPRELAGLGMDEVVVDLEAPVAVDRPLDGVVDRGSVVGEDASAARSIGKHPGMPIAANDLDDLGPGCANRSPRHARPSPYIACSRSWQSATIHDADV